MLQKKFFAVNIKIKHRENKRLEKWRKHIEKILNSLIQCVTAAAKSLQSCPTLWDPIVSSPPGSPIPGILQAKTLEWVAISFSSAWKWKVKVKSLSRVQLLVTPWTAAYQASPSMGFARQKYWSGVPLWGIKREWVCLWPLYSSFNFREATGAVSPALTLSMPYTQKIPGPSGFMGKLYQTFQFYASTSRD